MSVLQTRGLKYYAAINGALVQFQCLNDIQLGSDSTDKIETTCYEDRTHRRYTNGLAQAGEGSLGFQLDNENPSHAQMIQIASEGTTEMEFAIAIDDAADGENPVPTIEGGKLVLPEGRTWFTYLGVLSNPTPTFELGGTVNYTVTLQRNSGIIYMPRVVEDPEDPEDPDAP